MTQEAWDLGFRGVMLGDVSVSSATNTQQTHSS